MKKITKSTAKKCAATSAKKAPPKKAIAKKTTVRKTEKPFVKYQTVWNNVGGGLSSPGSSKLCRVGKNKLLVTRADKLDRYGNPVHSVSVIDNKGNTVATAKGNGSATLVASNALKKVGVDTRR